MTVLPYARPLMLPAAGTPARWALLPLQLAPRAANADPVPPKSGGRRFQLHPDDAIRVDHYMRRHGTDAVTSDGLTALVLEGADLVECTTSTAATAAPRILVQFCPLAWLGNGTVPAGAPELVDVTNKVLQMTSQDICEARDGSTTANELVEAEDRGHLGPHRVMCEQALCRYFGVEDVVDVTDDVIANRRDGKRVLPGVLPTHGEGTFWMLGGADEMHFACRADTVDAALAQCRATFPAMRVTSATSFAA